MYFSTLQYCKNCFVKVNSIKYDITLDYIYSKLYIFNFYIQYINI